MKVEIRDQFVDRDTLMRVTDATADDHVKLGAICGALRLGEYVVHVHTINPMQYQRNSFL